MRKIYTAITMLLFSVSVFALETEFVSAAAEQATPTDIVTFVIDGQTANAAIDTDAKTVTINLPTDSDITSLTPEFTLSEGASAYIGQVTETTLQESGVSAVDFTSAVTYTVVNDTEQSDWVVTVTVGVSVDENALELVSAYPNPAKDKLTVANLEGATQLIVSNILGQTKVVKPVNAKSMTINTAEFDAGIYIVTVVAENGALKALRIIKE